MKRFLADFIHTYFGRKLDLRVRILNDLATAGCITCLVEGFVNLFSGMGAPAP